MRLVLEAGAARFHAGASPFADKLKRANDSTYGLRGESDCHRQLTFSKVQFLGALQLQFIAGLEERSERLGIRFHLG